MRDSGDGPGTDNTTKTRWEYKLNDRCGLLLNVTESKDRYEEVAFAKNHRYGFTLSRQVRDGGWVIAEMKSADSAEDSSSTMRHVAELSKVAGMHLLSLDGKYLSELVREPYFRVLACAEVDREGVRVMKVDFSRPHPVERSSTLDQWFQGGTMYLDPGRFWCLRYCELQLDVPNEFTGTSKTAIELRKDSGSFPVPVHVRTERHYKTDARHVAKGKQPDTRTVDVYEFDLTMPQRLPSDEEFTLGAFGLPDPFKARSFPIPWALIIVTSGSLFTGLEREAAPRLRAVEPVLLVNELGHNENCTF